MDPEICIGDTRATMHSIVHNHGSQNYCKAIIIDNMVGVTEPPAKAITIMDIPTTLHEISGEDKIVAEEAATDESDKETIKMENHCISANKQRYNPWLKIDEFSSLLWIDILCVFPLDKHLALMKHFSGHMGVSVSK